MWYFVKAPRFFKILFPDLLWNLSQKEKKIYLTFDDGPIPEVTQWVLDELDKWKAEGTFFCIGKNAEESPEILNEIKRRGHSIGNHTQYHVNGWKSRVSLYLNDVKKANEILQTKLFRPPYGRIKPAQLKILKKDYRIVMWDVLSGDWDERISPEKCLQNVLRYTEAGSIVVFHDNQKAFSKLKFALPRTLEYFSKKGYTFAAIK